MPNNRGLYDYEQWTIQPFTDQYRNLTCNQCTFLLDARAALRICILIVENDQLDQAWIWKSLKIWDATIKRRILKKENLTIRISPYSRFLFRIDIRLRDSEFIAKYNRYLVQKNRRRI